MHHARPAQCYLNRISGRGTLYEVIQISGWVLLTLNNLLLPSLSLISVSLICTLFFYLCLSFGSRMATISALCNMFSRISSPVERCDGNPAISEWEHTGHYFPRYGLPSLYILQADGRNKALGILRGNLNQSIKTEK